MFKVSVKIPMNVGHFLIGDFDEESIPHRHPYEVEWLCSVDILDDNGFSVDIAKMKELLGIVANEISNLMLNDLSYFRNRQTSIEHFASFVDMRLREIDSNEMPGIFENLRSSEIRVWEDPGAWASIISD